MVDKVEDLVVPSASELGIGITPSKESGRTPEKSSKKERATSQLAPRFGFSADELDTDVDMAEVSLTADKKIYEAGPNAFRIRYKFHLMSSLPEEDTSKVKKGDIYIDQQTREYLGRNPDGEIIRLKLPEGIDLSNLPLRLDDPILRQQILKFTSSEAGGKLTLNVEPDANELRRIVAEICLNEITRYKGFCEYRDKLTDEFMRPFNSAEKKFFSDVRERLNELVIIQEECIRKLLELLDYKDLNALGEELAKEIPEVKKAVKGELQGDDVLSKVMITTSLTSTHIVQYLAEKLKGQDAAVVDDKVVRALKTVSEATRASRDLIARLKADGPVFKRISEYYAQSSLVYHAERRERFQPSVMPIFSGYKSAACGYDLGSFFSRLVTKRKTEYVNAAKVIDDAWEHPSEGNISSLVSELWQTAVMCNEQMNEMGKGYVLCLMSSLPDNESQKAKKGKIYIEEGTRRFVVRGPNGKIHRGFLPESFKISGYDIDMPINLNGLSSKLENKQLKGNIITFLSKEGYVVDELSVANEIRPPRSMPRVSSQLFSMLGMAEIATAKIKSAVELLKKGPFWGAPADLCAKGSYYDAVGRAWDVVQSYQETSKSNSGIKSWKLIRRDSNGKQEEQVNSKLSKRFRRGDLAEIYEEKELVCIVTPQKMDGDAEGEFSGVGIKMNRHNRKDMVLAVRTMAGSLADEKKEICITIDFQLPGADELALQYAQAILDQCITPIFYRELSEEETQTLSEKEIAVLHKKETEAKLIELVARMAEQGNNDYANLVEQYRAHLDTVEIQEKEDKSFLSAFKEFVKKPLTPTLCMQYPVNGPLLDKGEIVSRLATAFMSHNLTADEFVDSIIHYAQAMVPNRGKRLAPKKFEKLKKGLRIYIEGCIDEQFRDLKPGESLALKEAYFARQIFNTAFAALEPELDVTLYSDYFFPSMQKTATLQVELDAKRNNGNAPPQVSPEVVIEKIEISDPEDRNEGFENASEKDSSTLTRSADPFTDDIALSEQDADNTDDELGDSLFTEDSEAESQIRLDEFRLPKASPIVIPDVLSKETVIASKPEVSAMPSKAIVPATSVSKAVEPAVVIPANTAKDDRSPAVTAVPSQRPAFLADIEKGDFTFARKPAVERLTQSAPQNPRASLLSQLKSGNLRDTLRSVSEAERPKRHTDRLQGTLFQTAASLIAVRRKAIIDDAREDTDNDDDWDNVVDTVNAAKSIDEDTVFLQNLDAILQQRKLLTETNQPITMQDPTTAKELNELAILTRLATMALVDKTMTEEAFLERIITFAFVSPKLASNVPLMPQKTEELKKELRSKFQGKEIDPAHIDELVSKLVKIARHEYSKGHTADEITGQHRDLYAPLQTMTVPSHHDDDGEGETRAPAISHPH